MHRVFFCGVVLLATTSHAFELDERAAVPGEWGFRPQPGAKVELNPPGFTWRPQKESSGYQLQISRDEEFQDVVYDVETRWSAHCPSQTLPGGTLYWRYRARGSDGSVSNWSRARQFLVPNNTAAYPQPTVDELKSRLPDERPRLFMRPQDLPRLRALADGELSPQWQAIKQAADKLLVNPPDTGEPPTYPEGMVRKDGEWKKVWWGNRERAVKVADGAATLAFAYRITGDEQYATAARELLLELTEWDPAGATNYEYNDEAAMPILYMASRAYDWVHPVLTEDDRARIIAMQRVRGRQCFDHLTRRQHLWRPYGSHVQRAWHQLAELATAFMGDIPEAEMWLDYAMTVYFTCYPVWSDGDGGWHEGIAYWNSYINRFMQWAYVMDRAYQIDAFQRPYFKRAGYFPMYVMPPGTQHGGFGDMAPRVRSASVAPLVARLASGAGNGHWKWFADEHDAKYLGTYLGFFAAARGLDVPTKAPTNLPSSAVFEGVGVAALNTTILSADQNVQLLFKSSPMGTISHGYNAQNTFQLNVGGKPLLQNTGRRDIHGSPHHTQWMWQAKSQNVILLNGEGAASDRYQAVGRITHFRTSGALDVVAGEAGNAYPALKRWSRRIVFLKPRVILIHDLLESKDPATFQYLLHAPGRFELGPDRTAAFSAEHGSVQIEFLHPAELRISQTDQYDPPPADWSKLALGEWHLTAATQVESTKQELLTVLRVNEQEVEIDYARTQHGFDVTVGISGMEHHISLFEDGFDVVSGPLHWSFADSGMEE